MSQCEKWEKLIARKLAGEISPEDNERLSSHAESCDHCAEFLKIHDTLEQSELVIPLPDSEAFFSMRQKVLADIRKRRERIINWPMLGQRIMMLLWKPVTGYAVAALLLIIWIFRPTGSERAPWADKEEILQSINLVAERNTNLSEVRNSPYSYSNVSIRDRADGSVDLRFDVTTHVATTTHPDDPLVQELLAQAMIGDEPVGNRLKAIKRSRQSRDDKISQALQYTALNDENPAVRLKALEAVLDEPPSDHLRDVMLRVLKNETSVKMRLLAIDYLTQDTVGQNMLRENLLESDTPVNPALLIRAGRNSMDNTQTQGE